MATPSDFDSYTSQQPLSAWRRMTSLFVTHNSSYLISVSCVLHGTAHWFRHTSSADASAWPLMALVGGYIVLLALISFVIVRFGKLWDDARSILLMIPLLFVELSLAFDEVLLRDPITGRRLLLLGLAGAVLISEALIVGLRIRLSWRFRVPYHALWALLFLYPLSLAKLEVIRDPSSYSWRIFLFSTWAAGIVLMLWPAVRRGPSEIENNGTPWSWPAFPWSLFGMLFICVGFRACALSLSFDPVLSLHQAAADQFENAFGAYYLVPLVLAIGVLLLEAALVSRSDRLCRVVLSVPLLAVWMSIPARSAPTPYFEFLDRFQATLGSPVWVTILMAAGFYLWSWCRGLALAEFGWVTLMFLASVVGPASHSMGWMLPSELSSELWPLALIFLVELGLALRFRTSWRALLSLGSAFLIVDSIHLATEPNMVRFAGILAAVLIAMLWIGVSFHDRLAQLCQRAGAPLMAATSATGLWLMWSDQRALLWPQTLFVLLMTGLCVWYGAVIKRRDYLWSAVCQLACFGLAISVYWLAELRDSPQWPAVRSFVAGLACLLIGLMISSLKAGWLRMLWDHWNRLFLPNRAPTVRERSS